MELLSVYDFKPQLPISDVLKLVSNLRSGEFEYGDNLMLAGGILGELGALLKSGFVIGMSDDGMSENDLPSTISGCIQALEPLQLEQMDAQPALDPSIWIPIVIELIKLWMERRGR